MNRAAARSYPFQVIRKFMFNRPGEVFYIGGNDILPAPLSAEREAEVIEMLGTEKEKEGKSVLIEHNLRLVVYIAKKFDNTGETSFSWSAPSGSSIRLYPVCHPQPSTFGQLVVSFSVLT